MLVEPICNVESRSRVIVVVYRANKLRLWPATEDLIDNVVDLLMTRIQDTGLCILGASEGVLFGK